MRLWIAEGFIPKEEKKIPENVAEGYLMELIDKSLVIVAKGRSDGGVKACVVHDLLRELCLRMVEEENFLKPLDNDPLIYMKHQRLHAYNTRPDPMIKFEIFLPFGRKVRSFLAPYMMNTSLYDVNLKLLRALNWRKRFHSRDLVEAEHLVNLRYLAVTHIPASIGSLVNLEFLFVENQYTVLISSAMMKMMKLRYLQVKRGAIISKKSNRSQTNNLEFLGFVCIKTQQDEEMLKCSPNLRRLKCICETHSLDLRFLTLLESVKMNGSNLEGVAESNFPFNIKKLSLYGLKLPWEKMPMIGELFKFSNYNIVPFGDKDRTQKMANSSNSDSCNCIA